MYLTRIQPNLDYPIARAETHNVFALRKRLMTMFPYMDTEHHRKLVRMLFRVDATADGIVIATQTASRPDPDQIPARYGDTTTVDLNSVLHKLTAGAQYKYRITGNTIRRNKDNPNGIPITGDEPEALTNWWDRHCERIRVTPNTMTITPLPPYYIPDQNNMAVTRTKYEGILTVNNPDILREAITSGIGRAKSYGCGLLSLKPTSF